MSPLILEKLNRWLAVLLRCLIVIYRRAISPFLPARCRYYPTCSSYALEAIHLHGGYYGGWLAFKRVCRCHPWGRSGIDFVPLPLYRYRFYYLPVSCSQGYGVARTELWRTTQI